MTPRTRQLRCRANALIETALVLMLLVLLTFGAIEYGWMFLRLQQVTNAARQGVRVGSMADGTTAQVQAAVDAILQDTDMSGSGYTVTTSPAEVADAARLDPVTVTVVVPYANLELTHIPLLALPANLRASMTMAKEGP